MKRRKFLFISANKHTTPYPVYPLGISYLSSYLHDRLPGLETRIFDANLDSMEALITLLNDFQPDYTGISFRNVDDVNFYSQESFILGYRDILETIRQHSHSVLIIGGSAFSIFPRELFSFFNPDYGILGEGEDSLYRLILSLNEGTADLSIEGLVFRNKNKVVINARKNYIQTPNLCFEKNLVDFYWDKSGMMNIQTKRGCPYHCIYCTYPLIEGHKVRTLDPDKIIHTLKDLITDHQVEYVFFTDSVFNIHNPFNITLAEKMIASGINMKWGAYFSPHHLDRPLLELFHRAGLTHIEFGTESLSDTTLKNYGKLFTVDEVVDISRICNEVGIYFAHFLILGGYGETEQTIDESFENSKRMDNTVFFPYIGMRIYPGTRLQNLATAEGIIHSGDDLLEPVYYIAKGINYETLKQKADATGRRWVFPDEDVATIMNRMRKRKRKGSLWHHLKK